MSAEISSDSSIEITEMTDPWNEPQYIEQIDFEKFLDVFRLSKTSQIHSNS